MPGRWVREGIISSPRINTLSQGAELLYRRLMSVVDDFGRFHAAAASVRGACWPTCPEKFTDQIVGEWLAECWQPVNNLITGYKPLLIVYEVDGAKYLQVTDFGQNERSKSKFPAPANNLSTDCPQNVVPNRISESLSESLSSSDKQLAEIAEGFDRHLKHNRKEPRDLVIQNVMSMNGQFDWKKYRANHNPYCRHYADHGWDFCTLSFMGWINAGMPPPPPESKSGGRKGGSPQPPPSYPSLPTYKPAED